jgi:hypothetical protein
MPRVVPSQVVTVIDSMFRWAATQVEGQGERIQLHRDNSSRLAAVLALVQQIPQELLVLDDTKYSELVASIAAIQDIIPMWQFRDLPLEAVPGLSKLNPVTLIRRALAECPDEFPSSETTDLKFIPDQALRENLGIDISTADRAFSNGEWKAATVLAGSILEAMLLWALQQQSKAAISTATSNLITAKRLKNNPGPILEEWALNPYIEVAAELGLISADTASQARLAKDFRNLIHPGRALRLGQTWVLSQSCFFGNFGVCKSLNF